MLSSRLLLLEKKGTRGINGHDVVCILDDYVCYVQILMM